MRSLTMKKMREMIKDGRIECITDLKVGYVEVRWTHNNKRETVEVK